MSRWMKKNVLLFFAGVKIRRYRSKIESLVMKIKGP